MTAPGCVGYSSDLQIFLTFCNDKGFFRVHYTVHLSKLDQLFSLQSIALVLQIHKWILLSCVFTQLLACTFSSISSGHNPQLLTDHPAQQCLHPVLPNAPSGSFCISLKFLLPKVVMFWVSVREEEEQNELGNAVHVQITLAALQSVAASTWPRVRAAPSLLTFHRENLVARSKCEGVWQHNEWQRSLTWNVSLSAVGLDTCN